jgi:hypothetical protein
VSLWLGRVRYLSKLIDLGYNPLYLDTDFTVQDNFYKHLKSGPAAQHSLFFMREGRVRFRMRWTLIGVLASLGIWLLLRMHSLSAGFCRLEAVLANAL